MKIIIAGVAVKWTGDELIISRTNGEMIIGDLADRLAVIRTDDELYRALTAK